MLEFLGRGSDFADERNSAFFTYSKDLILLDCPATSFQKVKKMENLPIDKKIKTFKEQKKFRYVSSNHVYAIYMEPFSDDRHCGR